MSELHPDILAVIEGRSQWCVVTGDCLQILPTIPAGSVGAVVTDPPYGVGAARMSLGKWRTSRMEESDWDDKQPSLASVLAMNVPTVVWGGNYFQLPPSRGFLIWNKGAGFVGRDFAECEMAWCSTDSNARVLTYDPLAGGDYRKKEHPTQKPLPVMVWCMKFVPSDTVVLDPFCGSGTTGLAAIQTGRRFIGIEIDPRYADIARRRISDAAPLFVPPTETKPEPALFGESV